MNESLDLTTGKDPDPTNGRPVTESKPTHKDRVRYAIVAGFMISLGIVIIGSFTLLSFRQVDNAKDIIQLIFTPLLTAATPIFGFYFAQKSN